MNYVPFAVVAIVPTVIAFWYFLTRPHLGVWSKVIIFTIWLVTLIPLGVVIYVLTALLMVMAVVGKPVLWDSGFDPPVILVFAPVPLLLNGYLALMAYGLDSRRSRRAATSSL